MSRAEIFPLMTPAEEAKASALLRKYVEQYYLGTFEEPGKRSTIRSCMVSLEEALENSRRQRRAIEKRERRALRNLRVTA